MLIFPTFLIIFRKFCGLRLVCYNSIPILSRKLIFNNVTEREPQRKREPRREKTAETERERERETGIGERLRDKRDKSGREKPREKDRKKDRVGEGERNVGGEIGVRER